MQTSRINHTRRLLALMIAFVCGILLITTVLHIRWDKEQVVHQYTEQMQTLASVLNGQAEATIREAHTVLTGLVARYGAGEPIVHNPRDLELVARSQLANLSEVNGLFISDAKGRYLLNTNRPVPNLNNSDREYFQHHKNSDSPELFIGKPIKGKTTGEWVITLSMRISGPDNEFLGVALATMNVQRFVSEYDGIPLGDQGIIVLAKRDGTVLARSQSDAQTYVTNISKSPMLQQVNAGNWRGTVSLTSIIDGVPRVYGFDASRSYPVLVAVAIPEREALATWRKRSWSMGAVTAIAVLIVAAMGVFIWLALGKQAVMETNLQRAHESLREANQALEIKAAEDGLTGLANRRQLDESLSSTFNRAKQSGVTLAFALIDVDHFKRYNDTYGHPAGDQALIELANVMRSRVRKATDLVARYGGEEMALILPGADTAAASHIAEEIRKEIELRSILHEGSPFGHVTVSIGVVAAIPGQHFDEPNQMVMSADQALYEAKRKGRNQVVAGLPPA